MFRILYHVSYINEIHGQKTSRFIKIFRIIFRLFATRHAIIVMNHLLFCYLLNITDQRCNSTHNVIYNQQSKIEQWY